jgi:shikimate kinase
VPAPSDNDRERPIVLIGFMGTGKTTVGRLLAGRLGWRFVDLDRAIEEQAGVSIPEIFRTRGEPAFRQLEAEALERALGEGDGKTVLATGGGAACREPNLTMMLTRGQVVGLAVTPEEALRRAGPASGRPMLDGPQDRLASATALLAEREPFYARAPVRIDTVGKTPERVVAEVLAALTGGEAR